MPGTTIIHKQGSSGTWVARPYDLTIIRSCRGAEGNPRLREHQPNECKRLQLGGQAPICGDGLAPANNSSGLKVLHTKRAPGPFPGGLLEILVSGGVGESGTRRADGARAIATRRVLVRARVSRAAWTSLPAGTAASTKSRARLNR